MQRLSTLASLIFLGVNLLAAQAPAAERITVQSGPLRAHLLELFTSEGCSSCPPAERWLSTLRQNPRLWKDVVPVAFHVDYWDNLGWKDALASRTFTARQHDYAAAWGASSVYTPGFVLDGGEWRGRDLNAVSDTKADAGKLTAIWQENGDVQVSYSPAAGAAEKWEAHVALLGFGVTSDVKAGENSGRKLVHDFAVLALQSGGLAKTGDAFRATLRLPADKARRGQAALAVWVTEAGKLTPIQAAGGEL